MAAVLGADFTSMSIVLITYSGCKYIFSGAFPTSEILTSLGSYGVITAF